jgi:hypothetical protein
MAEPCPWTVYACDLFKSHFERTALTIARSHTGGTLSMLSTNIITEVTRVMVLHMVRLMQVNVQGKKSPNYCFTSRPFSLLVVAVYSHLIFCAPQTRVPTRV